jgi:hypothetical protein
LTPSQFLVRPTLLIAIPSRLHSTATCATKVPAQGVRTHGGVSCGTIQDEPTPEQPQQPDVLRMVIAAAEARGESIKFKVKCRRPGDGGQGALGEGAMEKPAVNPMRSAMQAPRCGARTRAGRPCRGPATAKGRCRMHGGAAGSGAPPGPRNGNYRHGIFTKEMIEMRRLVRELVRR